MAVARRVKLAAIVFAMTLSTLSIGGYVASNRARLSALVQPQPFVMKLRRTCTTCPNYTITLNGDGLLTYEGGDFALVRGVHKSYVDTEIATALFNEFVQSEFMDMDNSYPAPGENRMTVSLFIETAGLSKSVYSEERYGPALRQELERKMDDLPGMRTLSGWTY